MKGRGEGIVLYTTKDMIGAPCVPLVFCRLLCSYIIITSSIDTTTAATWLLDFNHLVLLLLGTQARPDISSLFIDRYRSD